jgi:voltage-gated potassium channel Kch
MLSAARTQVVANMLASPLTGEPLRWVAFSFNPVAVRAANVQGMPVFFGDGANAAVLGAAISSVPRAFVIAYRSHPQLVDAVRSVRAAFPTVPVFGLATDVRRAGEVQRLGATAVVTRASAGVALGDAVLRGLMSTSVVDLVFLEQEMQLAVRDAVESSERGLERAVRATGRGENGSLDDADAAGIFILDTTMPKTVRRFCSSIEGSCGSGCGSAAAMSPVCHGLSHAVLGVRNAAKRALGIAIQALARGNVAGS